MVNKKVLRRYLIWHTGHHPLSPRLQLFQLHSRWVQLTWWLIQSVTLKRVSRQALAWSLIIRWLIQPSNRSVLIVNLRIKKILAVIVRRRRILVHKAVKTIRVQRLLVRKQERVMPTALLPISRSRRVAIRLLITITRVRTILSQQRHLHKLMIRKQIMSQTELALPAILEVPARRRLNKGVAVVV